VVVEREKEEEEEEEEAALFSTAEAPPWYGGIRVSLFRPRNRRPRVRRPGSSETEFPFGEGTEGSPSLPDRPL
jgi:hypothetical protein